MSNQFYILRINSIWPWYSILFLYSIYLDLIISIKDSCIFTYRRNMPLIFLSCNDFSGFRIKVVPASFLTYLEELIGEVIGFWWFFTYFLENMHCTFLIYGFNIRVTCGSVYIVFYLFVLSYWPCFLASLLTLSWTVECM